MADPIKSPFNDQPHEGMEHKTDPSIAKGRFVADDVLNAFKNWGLDAASALPEAIGGAVDLADQNLTGSSALGGDSWANHIHEKSRNLLGGGNVPDEQKTPEGSLIRLLNPIDPVKAAKAAKILAAGGAAAMAASAVTKGSKALSRVGKAAEEGAIKLGGGNWVDPSVTQLIDRSIESAMNMDDIHPHVLIDVRHWANKKLGDYVNKEMATPQDPIRKLADQGITHLPEHHEFSAYGHPLTQNQVNQEAEFARSRGFIDEDESVRNLPAKNKSLDSVAATMDPTSQQIYKDTGILPVHGGTDKGIDWENMADLSVQTRAPMAAKDHYPDDSYPAYLDKVPPDTPVYKINPSVGGGALGFQHILKTVSDGLESGKIDPAKLDKLSVADAVRMTHDRHVADAKELETQRRLEQEKQGVHKFDDGTQWVQLTKPGQFARESDMMSHSVRGYEPPRGHEDWIPQSGNSGHKSYGHGGYGGIKSGKAEVYSLRDKDNKAGITIEARVSKPSEKVNVNDFMHQDLGQLYDPLSEALEKNLSKDQMQELHDYWNEETPEKLGKTPDPHDLAEYFMEYLDNYDEGIPHVDVKDVVERYLDDSGIDIQTARGVLRDLDNYVKSMMPDPSSGTTRAVTQVKPRGNYTTDADPEHTDKIIEFLNSDRFKNFIPTNVSDLKMMNIYPIRGRGEGFEKRMATLKRLVNEDPHLKQFWDARDFDKENVVPIGNIQYMANKLYSKYRGRHFPPGEEPSEVIDLMWLLGDSQKQ